MCDCTIDIDISGAKRANLSIGFGDTLSLVLSFRDKTTGDLVDLSGATVSLSVVDYLGKEKATLSATVNGSTDKATFTFTTGFWAKLKKQDYDYSIVKTISGVTGKLMYGQFKPY